MNVKRNIIFLTVILFSSLLFTSNAFASGFDVTPNNVVLDTANVNTLYTNSFQITNNSSDTIADILFLGNQTSTTVHLSYVSGCDSIPSDQLGYDGDGNLNAFTCATSLAPGETKTYTVEIGSNQLPNTLNLRMDTASDSYGAGTSIDIPLTLIDTPTVTPTPTISGTASIDVSPSSGTKIVGTPFNITVAVNSTAGAFNAARASISVSSNLTISGLHNATSNACNFQYTKTPTTSDPSFAGAIFGSSSSSCNVYTVTLTPNASGTGTITLSNGSIKSYADSSEILTGVQNASYTINAAGDTPTPTSPLSQLTVSSPLETYKTSYNLGGTKDTAITSVFVNGSSTGVIYPTDTTWQITKTLSLGNNAFTIYGADANSNQTATQNVTISRHTLGDINGDGTVDLTDASMFAIDFDKTSDLTYILSDMNDDGNADLTDLSIIAKLETE